MKISKHIACIVSTLLLTMAQTAWATSISTINVGGTDYTLFTGFTATDGTNDGYGNMVDGDTSTSFHVFASNAFVEFNTDEPIIPKGYIFNTYMDEYFFPTSWVLKAKVETSDEWTTLSTGSGGTTSGTEFTRSCDNNENNSYKYFRFEVTRSGYGNNDNIWLTEIRLYGNEYIYYTHLTVTPATCTATGIKQECYKRSDGKYFTDETGATELAESDVIEPMIAHTGVHHEAGDGNIEYWQCSMCSKYFTDAACTQEVTADEVLKTVFGTLTAGTNGASGYYTLESKTYTLTADVNTNGYIYVPEGVTATIDLNGHTIDRGLTSAVTNGMVIRVAGSLTVTDSGTGGKIKGGMDSSADHVSCVKVYSDNGSPTFTLQGGTLIGNTSHQYKCAVYASNSSNITISGGKITGDVYGIVSSGHVTVTGGEISGNTYGIWSKNYSISVSGNPVITNNTDANVKLYSDGASVLTIAGELTDGANIGITKGGVRPTDNAPVTVTSGYGTYNSNVSPSTYFSLDNNGQIQIGDDPYNPQYMTVVMGWNEDKTEIAVGTALYTVNFDMNGHGDAIDAVSLLSGYKLMKPEPTADGWFFSGWYTDDACTSQWNFNNAVTSNMTLHALWTQGQIYRVTLPEKMVIVSTTNALVGGKYPTGTNIRFKVAPDYVVDGDVKNGEDVLTADGDGIYTVTVADADITITATVKKAAEPNKTLSGSESYTANDGDVLTGSTSGTVTIPTGASITLSDVTISGGIVCNGTATITLVGTNSVTGFSRFDSNINAYRYTAGIQVGGSGTTLTIKGNGSLTANGALHSAGIGLSRAWDVDATGGHILIEGGNITATGNGKGAGIGTGACFGDTSDKTATLGNITIKGGTVRAIGGTDNGNGIGKGHAYSYGHAVVGTITIYDGINLVDASSISESVTYMHVENETETNVTESKADYFTIIENGNRRIIVQKVTPTIADVPDQTYTGSEITPEPLVIAGSLNLTKDEDYTYSYENNTNVGTATVRATFQGTYASLGSVEKTFTIVPSTIMVSVAGGGTVTIGDKSASDGEAFGVMSEKGASVVLTLAPESGNGVRSVAYGYTNSEGTNMNGAKLPISDGTATLTVPTDLKDGTGVTLTVTFAAALVGGADEDGAVALTDATVTDLAGGWYKVESDITFDHTLNLLGDTHLIIADSKTMTVNTASGKGIDSDYTLTVGGAGALSVTASGSNQIAVRVGNYVQTGATVTASGFIGIRCCDDFDGNVTNAFTFSGGQLTATGTSDGIRVDNTITLSCTNASDFIRSSSYSVSGGTVKVADGKALTDGTEASNGMNGYSGTLTNEQRTAIGGKTLRRAVTTSYVEASGTLHENVIAIPLDDTMTTLAAGWYVVNENVDYTGQITLSGDVKLILGDDCTMSFGKDELLNGTIIECNNHNLTIYGQSGGTGWLKAYSAQDDGIHNVYYTQYSGNVLIFDGNGACIYASEFTILGGTLDLESQGGGADGEIVTTGNINIRGGKLWARCKGLKTMSGKIILGYTNATDQIYVNSYQPQNGLQIADGKTLVDDYGVIWSGTLEYYQIHDINGRTLKPLIYTGVTLTKEYYNVSATFDGTSTTTVSIPVDVNVTSVTYNRTFTEGKPSTVMLPFSLGEGQTLTGGTLYKFTGVTKNETAGKWEATMTETATLQANTPYLLMPNNELTDGKVTFNLGSSWSTVTLNTTGGGNKVAEYDGFEMRGTYTEKVWEENDPEIGKAYLIGDGGELIPVTAGTKIRPTECYIIQTKKRMDGKDITVSIPAVEWTGSEVAFDASTVKVWDGTTLLTQTTDYTVTAPTGTLQDTGDYPVTITGAGEYIGTKEAMFTIKGAPITIKNQANEDVSSVDNAYTITTDQRGGATLTLVTPEPATPETPPTIVTVDIPTPVVVDHVDLDRIFEAGKACTLYLPFSIGVDKLAGGTFNTFVGVNTAVTPWEVQYSPVTTGEIAANTPYIFIPDGSNGGKIVVNNGEEKVTVCTANQHTTENGQWDFIGTYERIMWTHNTSDPEYTAAREAEIGSIYGFAAEEKSGATVGQFVKVTNNVWINPMRAYLKNSGGEAAPGLNGEAPTTELPEAMKVVIVEGSETTSLTPGPSPRNEGSGYWYTLEGQKLDGKPAKKGLYIHNGRKEVVK